MRNHIVRFLPGCSAECLNAASIGDNVTKWAMIITTNFEVGGGQVALQGLFSFGKRGEVTANTAFAATCAAMRSGHSSLHRVSG